MRIVFGLMALLIVLAAIGTLGKTQLSVLGISERTVTQSQGQGAETNSVTEAVMGRARSGTAATIAVPGGMSGAEAAVVDTTIPGQSRSIQNNVRDQTNAALQKGVERSNAAQP